MAVSTKKLRSSVVLVGAPAQGTGGGAGSPFTGVAPEGTSPGAGRTICALLPRHGPGSAGPAGDGTPVRPGTGPEGRPCRMWCSLLSVIARSSCCRSVTGGGVRRTAGGDDTDTGAPRACSKRRPSMVRIRRSAGMGCVRGGERPAAPDMSPWYRFVADSRRATVRADWLGPTLGSLFLPDRQWERPVMWRSGRGGFRTRCQPVGAAAVERWGLVSGLY